MDAIRQIGTTVCITMVAVGLFSMLIPNNNLAKTVKLTVSLFFICCIVVPMANLSFDFDSLAAGVSSGQPAEVSFDEQIHQQLVRMTEENISENIRLELEQENIRAENITVSAHIDEDSGISINNITFSADRENGSRAESLIRQLLEPEDVSVTVNILEE